jgi:flavin reductase (DIM6/NTAB) family NADH-FMN oxidoreductase RutF
MSVLFHDFCLPVFDGFIISRSYTPHSSGGFMMKEEVEPSRGMLAIPGFPVVLVTVDRNIMTAAAFSFYSFKPPSVMVGIMPQQLTFELISARKEFGINIPRADQVEAVGICGSISGRDADKYARAGLTPLKGLTIDSFLIAECPVNLECRVVHEVNFEGTHHWFIGEILTAYVEEDYARDDALMFWARELRAVGEVIIRNDE